MHYKVFRLWSPNRDEQSIRAFMAALSLRRQESWEWVADRKKSDFWVIDCHDGASAANLHQRYAVNPTDTQIVFCLGSQLPAGLQARFVFLKTPIKVRQLFDTLNDVIDGKHLSQTQAGATANKDEPWVHSRFKLLGWPNITHYDADIRIVELCTYLFTHQSTLAELDRFDLEASVIHEMLHDAHQNGLLHLTAVRPDVGATATKLGKDTSVLHTDKSATMAQGGAGIFRRLLKRFAISG